MGTTNKRYTRKPSTPSTTKRNPIVSRALSKGSKSGGKIGNVSGGSGAKVSTKSSGGSSSRSRGGGGGSSSSSQNVTIRTKENGQIVEKQISKQQLEKERVELVKGRQQESIRKQREADLVRTLQKTQQGKVKRTEQGIEVSKSNRKTTITHRGDILETPQSATVIPSQVKRKPVTTQLKDVKSKFERQAEKPYGSFQKKTISQVNKEIAEEKFKQAGTIQKAPSKLSSVSSFVYENVKEGFLKVDEAIIKPVSKEIKSFDTSKLITKKEELDKVGAIPRLFKTLQTAGSESAKQLPKTSTIIGTAVVGGAVFSILPQAVTSAPTIFGAITVSKFASGEPVTASSLLQTAGEVAFIKGIEATVKLPSKFNKPRIVGTKGQAIKSVSNNKKTLTAVKEITKVKAGRKTYLVEGTGKEVSYNIAKGKQKVIGEFKFQSRQTSTRNIITGKTKPTPDSPTKLSQQFSIGERYIKGDKSTTQINFLSKIQTDSKPVFQKGTSITKSEIFYKDNLGLIKSKSFSASKSSKFVTDPKDLILETKLKDSGIESGLLKELFRIDTGKTKITYSSAKTHTVKDTKSINIIKDTIKAKSNPKIKLDSKALDSANQFLQSKFKTASTVSSKPKQPPKFSEGVFSKKPKTIKKKIKQPKEKSIIENSIPKTKKQETLKITPRQNQQSTHKQKTIQIQEETQISPSASAVTQLRQGVISHIKAQQQSTKTSIVPISFNQGVIKPKSKIQQKETLKQSTQLSQRRILSIKPISKTRIGQSISQSKKIDSKSIAKPSSSTKHSSIIKQTQQPTQKQDSKQSQLTEQTQKTALITKPLTPQRPTTPSSPPQQPPELFKPFKSILKPTTAKQKAIGKFTTLVKTKGKFRKTFESEDIFEAFAVGKKTVAQSSSASFKVTDQKGELQNIGLNILGNKFRRSKINRGIIVEKRRFRIDTAGEKEEITKKGLFTLNILKNRKIFGGK